MRGRVYDTVQEAARALGVSPSTVKWAVQRGTTDRIGQGSGKYPRSSDMGARAGMPQPKKVSIGGREWESLSQLSRWMGYQSRWASGVIRTRGLGALTEAVVARLMSEEELTYAGASAGVTPARTSNFARTKRVNVTNKPIG